MEELLPDALLPEELFPDALLPDDLFPEELLPDALLPEDDFPDALLPFELLLGLSERSDVIISPVTTYSFIKTCFNFLNKFDFFSHF